MKRLPLLSNQNGSTLIVVALAVVVVAAAGLAGYRVMNSDTPVGVSSVQSGSSDGPKAINSSSDVKKASNALDSTTIDGDVNPGQLDGDINNLL